MSASRALTGRQLIAGLGRLGIGRGLLAKILRDTDLAWADIEAVL